MKCVIAVVQGAIVYLSTFNNEEEVQEEVQGLLLRGFNVQIKDFDSLWPLILNRTVKLL